jgi:hypothetical protein
LLDAVAWNWDPGYQVLRKVTEYRREVLLTVEERVRVLVEVEV